MSEMILEYVHTAFQRETYDVGVYGFVEEEEEEEEEGNGDARGRRIEHMTTFLAQTAVASICTISDLPLFSSSLL